MLSKINKNIKFRRRLSCVLVPIMIAYIFFPYIPIYGGEDTEVIATEQTSPSFETVPYHTLPTGKEAFNKAKDVAEKINKTEEKKMPQDQGTSASDSYASNYGVSAQVNPANGQLNLSFNNVQLPGICNGMDINLGLSCSGEKNSPFGLPSEWKFNIDYIDTLNSAYGKLFMNDGHNYTINPKYTSKDRYQSGLLYFPNESIKFENLAQDIPLPPKYDSSDEYHYLLTMHDGRHEYFDGYGKLICTDDRFGNRILYKYEKIIEHYDATPYNVRLSQIIDSYGQGKEDKNKGIRIVYSGDSNHPLITIIMPDNSTVKYDFRNEGKITITDVNGRNTLVTLQGVDDKVASIRYPSGAIVTYEYDGDAFLVYFTEQDKSEGNFNRITGISKVTEDPGNGGAQVVTEYYYKGDSSCNFTGYPNYVFGGKDALFESNNDTFTYTTTITKHVSAENGGDIITLKTFNHLHLPLEEIIKQNKEIKRDTVTKYIGQNDSGNFDQYDNLPSNYNLPRKTTVTTYGPSGSSTSVVETNYDNYGQTLSVAQYDKDIIVAKKEMTYFSNGLVNTQKETDYLDGKIINITNTLDDKGKYIANLKIIRDGCEKKEIICEADDCGRLISKTLKFATGCGTTSTTTMTSYDDPDPKNYKNNLTVTYTDGHGNSIKKVTDVTNGKIQSETDALGYETLYKYDKNGLVLTKIYADGSWEKEDKSNQNYVVDELSDGSMKCIYYDGFGNGVKETDNLGIGGCRERVLSTVTYNELGKPSSVTDRFGREITYIYNDFQGRETSEKKVFYGETNEKTIEYDDTMQVATVSINGIKVTKIRYDDQGNVLETVGLISGSPNDSKTPSVISKYNGEQELIEQSMVLTDGDFSAGRGTVLARGTMSYDVDGNLVNNTTVTSDGTEIEMTWNRDIFGNAARKITNYKKVSPGVDKPGMFVSEIKKYDDLSHLRQIMNTEEKNMFFDYDANGNIKYMTDYSGRKFEFVYNNMNRQVEMNYVSGGTEKKDALSIKTEYYPAQTKGAEGKIHYKELYTNGSLTDKIEYFYDVVKGVLTDIKYMDGKSMSIAYDEYSRIYQITDYAGITTTYDYDEYSNIKSVSNKYGKATYTYCTKDDDPLLGEGTTPKNVTYYNENGTEIQNVHYEYYSSIMTKKSPSLKSIETTDSNGNSVSKSVYTYDDMGRAASVKQTSKTASNDVNCNNYKVYTYNIMGQLIKEEVYNVDGVTKIRTTDFVYDVRGNILNTIIKDKQDKIVSSEQCTYDLDNRMLTLSETNGTATKTAVKVFDYDDNGSLKAIKVGSNSIEKFDYNMFNQLIQYTDPQGDKTGYDYYADNMRKDKYSISGAIRKSEQKKLTYYYSSSGDILNEKSGSGANEVMSSYLIGVERVLRAVQGKVEFYVKNHKDVMDTVDGNGKGYLKNKYQYTAYGEDTNLGSSEGKIETQNSTFDINENPFKYSGYYFDSESNLYYLKARYYSPELKRFISRDTADLMNKYAYGNGDPIGNSDPEGNSPITNLIAMIFATIVTAILSVYTYGGLTIINAYYDIELSAAIMVIMSSAVGAVCGGLTYAAIDSISQGIECAADRDYNFNWKELVGGTTMAFVYGAVGGAGGVLKKAELVNTFWRKFFLDVTVWTVIGVYAQVCNLVIYQNISLNQFGINIGLSCLTMGIINNGGGNIFCEYVGDALKNEYMRQMRNKHLLGCDRENCTMSLNVENLPISQWITLNFVWCVSGYLFSSMPGIETNAYLQSKIYGGGDQKKTVCNSSLNAAGLNNGGLAAIRIIGGSCSKPLAQFLASPQCGDTWFPIVVVSFDPLVDQMVGL